MGGTNSNSGSQSRIDAYRSRQSSSGAEGSCSASSRSSFYTNVIKRGARVRRRPWTYQIADKAVQRRLEDLVSDVVEFHQLVLEVVAVRKDFVEFGVEVVVVSIAVSSRSRSSLACRGGMRGHSEKGISERKKGSKAL